MADIMMQLGSFQFGLNTAAYQSLDRVKTYRWARQERIGKNDALQFTGFGEESINLSGVVYAQFGAGLGQLSDMRSSAQSGTPLLLVSGLGAIMGYWVIEEVREGQKIFAQYGAPKKQEFDIKLSYYGNVL